MKKQLENTSKKAKKSTNKQVADRTDEVLRFLCEGATRSHILQYAAKTWGLSESMADKYIAKANATLKEITAQSREHNLGVITSNWWDLYKEAKITADPWLQLAVLKELGKITRVEQPIVHNHVHNSKEFDAIPDEELDSMIAQQETH